MVSWNSSIFFKLNTITSIVGQIVSIICGFILPRYMLLYFGSAGMGLVSSITQILNGISLMQMGMGPVVQASMYKPLADNDESRLSAVYKTSEKFFRALAFVLVFYTICVAAFYPMVVATGYSYWYVVGLVFSISITLFTQYYYGMTNALLLHSDQRIYIEQCLRMLSIILNTGLSLLLIIFGFNLLEVKFFSAFILLITPIGMCFYVKKNYRIDTNIQLRGDEVKQKWDGFIQHMSAVCVDTAPVVILTMVSGVRDVAVYSVYALVINSAKNVVMAFINSAQNMFGNMFAKGELKNLNDTFDRFEIGMGFLITLIFAASAKLIVPFVLIYTKSVNDANYGNMVFAVSFVYASAIFCYRTIYYSLIKAAGHFKETQSGAITEVIINISLSVVLIFFYGISGLSFGILVAVFYRTYYCAWYLSKSIICRPLVKFYLNILLNVILLALCWFAYGEVDANVIGYVSWSILAVKVTILCILICGTGYYVVYRNKFLQVLSNIIKV